MNDTIDLDTGELIERPVSAPARPPRYESEQTGQFAEALAKAQGEMEAPKRTKPGTIKGVTKAGKPYEYTYMYAPFEEVVRVTKPLAKHGIAYHQGLVTRSGEYFVRTFLRHSGSGEFIASDYPVITDRAGPQGFGSAVTYAKRYGLSLALGLAAEDDDDGAAAQEESTPGVTLADQLDAFAKPAAKHKGPFSTGDGEDDRSHSANSVPTRSSRAKPKLVEPSPSNVADVALETLAMAEAEKGVASLQTWWATKLSQDQRDALKKLDESARPTAGWLVKLANAADARKGDPAA